MTGLLFLSAWFLLIDSPYRFELLPGWLTLTALVICCGVIDFEQRIIPNKVTYFGIFVGIILSMVYPALQGGADYDNFFKLQGEVFLPIFQNQFGLDNQEFNGSMWWGGLSSLMGIIVGYLVIAFFIEVGKIFFGRYLVKVNESVQISIENQVVRIGEESYDLKEVLSRKKDQIKVWLDDEGVLLIGETSVTVDGQEVSDETLKSARTKRWSIPCEVMGYGDAKMLAMCGAFLGPDSIFMILALSSILATSIFLPYTLFKRNFHYEVPFGVFIAIGAYLVCLFA
jgi:prepilin signal peptidase PulO-like enzyme (type II secretory pathway)